MVNAVLRDGSFSFPLFSFEHLLFCTYQRFAQHIARPQPRVR